MPTQVPEMIFRKYDIRGEVDTELTPENVYQIARGIGTKMVRAGETQVIIGRDGRLSGPELCQKLAEGLMKSGLDVIDVGMVPSPVLYFATNILSTKSGVMLTGSHNPSNYNGLKILINGVTLSGDDIHSIYELLDAEDLENSSGNLSQDCVNDRYVQRIVGEVKLDRKMKIVIDSGNGVTGKLAPEVFRALGCDVVELFTEIDGTFPNHHPDPLKPENLKDLQDQLDKEHADVGFAFDGDGDRLGVVSNKGNIIWADRVMMLLSEGVLKAHPGATIVYDVKCTKFLPDVIKQAGGNAVLSATGHSIMKANLKKYGAELAGELSGHIFFKERWYGFDDGIYAGVRLLEMLSQSDKTTDEIFAAYPEGVSTPELNIGVTEAEKFQIVDTLVANAQFDDAEVLTIDGMRVEFPNGWALIRASNTTANLVLRFEAVDQVSLEIIMNRMRSYIQAHTPQVEINF